MKKRILLILKSKKGMSDVVAAIAMLIVFVLIMIFVIGGMALAHMYSLTDEFADEMISTASRYGTIKGDIVDERYNHLVDTLKIKPTYSFTAKNKNKTATDKVQEGEEIVLTLNYIAYLYGPEFMGHKIKIPVPITEKRTKISTQYWKELEGDFYAY